MILLPGGLFLTTSLSSIPVAINFAILQYYNHHHHHHHHRHRHHHHLTALFNSTSSPPECPLQTWTVLDPLARRAQNPPRMIAKTGPRSQTGLSDDASRTAFPRGNTVSPLSMRLRSTRADSHCLSRREDETASPFRISRILLVLLTVHLSVRSTAPASSPTAVGQREPSVFSNRCFPLRTRHSRTPTVSRRVRRRTGDLHPTALRLLRDCLPSRARNTLVPLPLAGTHRP